MKHFSCVRTLSTQSKTLNIRRIERLGRRSRKAYRFPWVNRVRYIVDRKYGSNSKMYNTWKDLQSKLFSLVNLSLGLWPLPSSSYTTRSSSKTKLSWLWGWTMDNYNLPSVDLYISRELMKPLEIYLVHLKSQASQYVRFVNLAWDLWRWCLFNKCYFGLG